MVIFFPGLGTYLIVEKVSMPMQGSCLNLSFSGNTLRPVENISEQTAGQSTADLEKHTLPTG